MLRATLLAAVAGLALADSDFHSKDCNPPDCACTADSDSSSSDDSVSKQLDRLKGRRDALKDCYKLVYDQQKKGNYIKYESAREDLRQDRNRKMHAAENKEKEARHWAHITKHETRKREDKVFKWRYEELRNDAEAKMHQADDDADNDYHKAVGAARKQYASDLASVAGNSAASPQLRMMARARLAELPNTGSAPALSLVVALSVAVVAAVWWVTRRSEAPRPTSKGTGYGATI